MISDKPDTSSMPSSMAASMDSLQVLERRYAAHLKRVSHLIMSDENDRRHSEDAMKKEYAIFSKIRHDMATFYKARLSSSTEAKGLGNQLWLLYYREMEQLQAKIRKVRSHGDLYMRYKNRLEEVMMETAEMLTSTLDDMCEIDEEGGEIWKNEEEVVGIFVSLGDLARYAARLMEQSTDDGDAKDRLDHCINEARRWYNKAIETRPCYGKSYNQLAIVQQMRLSSSSPNAPLDVEITFKAALDYTRALLAEEAFPSRDNLKALLDRWRSKYELYLTTERSKNVVLIGNKVKLRNTRLNDRNASLPLSISGSDGSIEGRNFLSMTSKEHRQQALEILLKTLHMLYSKTDLDQVSQRAQTLRKHIAMLSQRQKAKDIGEKERMVDCASLFVNIAVVVLGAVMSRPHYCTPPTPSPADLRAALSLLSEISQVMAGDGENSTRGWDEIRGPALLLILHWWRCQRKYNWLWEMTPGIAEVCRAAERHLAIEQQQVKEMHVIDAPAVWSWEKMVLGLPGFLEEDVRQEKRRCLTLTDTEKEGEQHPPTDFQIHQCRLIIEKFREAGTFKHLPSAAQDDGRSCDDGLTPISSKNGSCPFCRSMVVKEGSVCESCGASFDARDNFSASTKNSLGGILVGVDLSGGSTEALERKRSSISSSSTTAAIPSPHISPTFTTVSANQVVVIDASNVAMRHGLKKVFSSLGIALALDYFKSLGHRAVAFIPDYHLDFEKIGELKRTQKVLGTVRASQIPDNVVLLQNLMEERLLVGTPPQDYDDSYCIRYAQQHDGYVVSNDLYRDHLSKIEDRHEREQTRKWLRARCISFTFVGDDFIPNPDFRFESSKK